MRFPSAAQRITKILSVLDQTYPDAACSLNFSNPLELLVATILSAQCTDMLVNKVTMDLFKTYTTAQDYADADLIALQHDIARVNFYRNKAKSIQGACRMIVARFGGRVPHRMEELVQLPGVARKTANMVLGNAFHVQAGIVVDTHVMRVSQRMGLTTHTEREKIEQDLLRLVPQKRWTMFGHQMITHGRRVCTARAPKCHHCPIGKTLCPSYLTA